MIEVVSFSYVEEFVILLFFWWIKWCLVWFMWDVSVLLIVWVLLLCLIFMFVLNIFLLYVYIFIRLIRMYSWFIDLVINLSFSGCVLFLMVLDFEYVNGMLYYFFDLCLNLIIFFLGRMSFEGVWDCIVILLIWIWMFWIICRFLFFNFNVKCVLLEFVDFM